MTNTITTASAASRPKVLIITGPTAVGKTNVSLDLAERFGGEIISADSVQVYKGLDIGSDKIPVAERRGIPHHIIDLLDPSEDFNAGEFYERARTVTEDILSRGKVPIVVGGTGFYLKWYMHGKPGTASSTKESEATANAKLEQAWTEASNKLGRELTPEEKWEAGVKVIEELGDVESAARVRKEYNNYYRLQRVVDILLQSGGKTLKELNLDVKKPLDYDFRTYFLVRPREELYRRIDGRVEEMVAGGLLKECYGLLKQGLRPNSNCATKAIGYRQGMEFLDDYINNNNTSEIDTNNTTKTTASVGLGGSQKKKQKLENNNDKQPKVLNEEAVVNLVRDVQSASRQFCRRQFNWFRENDTFLWIDAARDRDVILQDILHSWELESHQGDYVVGKGGYLADDEKKEMRRYVSKMALYVKGGKQVQDTLAEVQELLLLQKTNL